MFSRRLFLKTFLAILAGLHFGGTTVAAGIFFRPRKSAPPRTRENVFVDRDGRALVGVSGRGSVSEMIREAVGLIGGFERLALAGKSVLVKPNVVSGVSNPTTTNPGVVAALVRILYEEGAKKVYVGDMSALSTLSTIRNMRRSGIKKAAEEAGAEVIAFEDYDWVGVKLNGNSFVKNAYVTEWLYKTDLIINLPVIKTHRSATYTITLKNFIGCTHLKQRPYLIDSDHWEEIVAEFNAAYTPELNIVDGTVSMVEGGPWKGTARETGLIIASGDRVGADVTGLGVIKSFGLWPPVAEKGVWEQKQIVTAVKRGVGRSRDGIKLVSGEGDEGFKGLMKDVSRYTGL